jgi:hypothetical protein
MKLLGAIFIAFISVQSLTEGYSQDDNFDERLLLNMLRASTNDRKEQFGDEHAGGLVYTRWGRTDCRTSQDVEIVYVGRVAGTVSAKPGGGANYLCLPNKSKYYHETGKPTYQSFLYGTKYIFYGSLLNTLNKHSAPCVVCYVKSKHALLVTPAATECPGDGWTEEYHGYLVAGYYGHPHSSVYECLDKNPQSIPNSAANIDGTLFYFVETTCHGLKCPPYKNKGITACAVCTR